MKKRTRNILIIVLVIAVVVPAAIWRLAPRKLYEVSNMILTRSMGVYLVHVDGDYGSIYDLPDLTPTDDADTYYLIMDALSDMDLRPSFRNLLGGVKTVPADVDDRLTLSITLHSDHDKFSGGSTALFFPDGNTLYLTGGMGKYQIYHIADPTWLDAITDHLIEYGALTN